MLWPFCPLDGMLESMGWRTDVLRAFSAEQRIRLMDRPRRTLSHSYRLTPRQVEIASCLLRAQSPGSFDVPEWQETTRITVMAGATVVAIDTTASQYVVGEKVVVWKDSDTNQVLTISSIAADSITFTAPVADNYINAVIAPVSTAYAPNGMELSRNVDPVHAASVEWLAFDGPDLADVGSLGSYRGDPLMPAAARVGSSALAEKLVRDVEIVDNAIARPYYDTALSAPVQTLGAAWLTSNAADLWTLRTLMHYLRGRQRAFWLPSWNNGLTLASNAAMSATTLSVRAVGLSTGVTTGDLLIKRKNGTTLALQYTNAVAAGANETLTLSAPLASAIATADVFVFCRLLRVRLDADRVEFAHNAPRITKCLVPVIEVPIA